MYAWPSKRHWFAALLLGCCFANALAQTRIVTLAPHATEMVFAAGAGDQIVATVQSSDYPLATQNIPKIGDGQNTGLEQVLAQKPDLVVGWPSTLLRQLQQHGIPTYTHMPDSMAALIDNIDALGYQLGTAEAAQRTTATLRHQLDNIPIKKPVRAPRVIVMVSPSDDYVIGRDPLINDAIERCGGHNPFASSPLLAPKVNLESMISSKPDLIVTGHSTTARLRQIAPVHVIDADLLYRPGPRFIEAIRLLCEAIARH